MTTTEYLWDPVNDSLAQETDESGVTQAIYTLEPTYYGPLVSDRRASETRFYHFDAIGSTRDLTATDGLVTDTFSFNAFGGLAAKTGTSETRHRWNGRTGYLYCPTADVYDVRRRAYMHNTGRWLSVVSPAFDGLAMSEYIYASNSPLVNICPSGSVSVRAVGGRVFIAPARNRCEDAYEDCSQRCAAIAIAEACVVLGVFASCIAHGFHICYWPCLIPNNPICNEPVSIPAESTPAGRTNLKRLSQFG